MKPTQGGGGAMRLAAIALFLFAGMVACDREAEKVLGPEERSGPSLSASVTTSATSISSVAAVDVGSFHSCVLTSAGAIKCWGDNYWGSSNVPPGTFSQLSAGSSLTCAVSASGSAQCWGYNSYGQANAPAGAFAQVSAAGGSAYTTHSCAVTANQAIQCWGDNTWGQLNPPPGTFKQVAVGERFTCGLTAGGVIHCWGYSSHGQTSAPAGTFKQISVRLAHGCGITTDNRVKCWGFNDYGQANAPAAGTFSQVAAGIHHSCAVSTDGSVQCWGGDNGQLNVPPGTYTQVSSGWYHNCALTTAGAVRCWGQNNYGQTSVPPEFVNQSPVASAGGPYAGVEGAPVVFDGSGSSDPDGDALTFAWDLDADGDYGDAADAALDESGAAAVGAGASRRYADNSAPAAPFTVGVKVSDLAGGSSAASADVTVANVAPSITALTAPTDPIPLVSGSASAPIAVSFTDPGADAHGTAIDCGNNTLAASGICSYAAAGVYVVTATVTETDPESASDTETYRYVVVYDPSAGFVTGGGWISSPAGAYPADAALAGRASFGFVSKYINGRTTPDGQTEFQFNAARMRFESTRYEWLVISGPKAQYKGEGKINGAGDYRFLLTAIDGQASGGGGADRFRLKIWDKATNGVVYDNQIGDADAGDAATVLGGGSIMIHKK